MINDDQWQPDRDEKRAVIHAVNGFDEALRSRAEWDEVARWLAPDLRLPPPAELLEQWQEGAARLDQQNVRHVIRGCIPGVVVVLGFDFDDVTVAPTVESGDLVGVKVADEQLVIVKESFVIVQHAEEWLIMRLDDRVDLLLGGADEEE